MFDFVDKTCNQMPSTIQLYRKSVLRFFNLRTKKGWIPGTEPTIVATQYCCGHPQNGSASVSAYLAPISAQNNRKNSSNSQILLIIAIMAYRCGLPVDRLQQNGGTPPHIYRNKHLGLLTGKSESLSIDFL